MHHAFLYISLPSLHDYNVKIISRFVEDVNARRRLPFSFPELSSKERLKFPYDNRAGEWSLGLVKIYIYFSSPPASLFVSRLSFLLFVISNVCTKHKVTGESTATRSAVYGTKGDTSQRRKTRELSGRLNHSPIDLFNAPFLLRYIV